ncbi:MAG: glutathione S-transferase C-terminal domain-containing protein, partial [Cyanobacteria bacterium J06635_15]
MGKSLPPGLLIKTGKFVWSTMWHVMMSQMAPRNTSGVYLRPESSFRQWVKADSDGDFPPEMGRYQLVVGLGCPWAHRTLVTRVLKGLDEAIAIVPVSPSPDQGMWVMDQPFEGCKTLPDLYQKAQPGYSGRCTVPVLWDSQRKTIVNNESADIIVMLNDGFNGLAKHREYNLYPNELKDTIDDWNEKIYATVNNGVYRCGFAQTQTAYDKACQALFSTLDEIDNLLTTQRYLCGDCITLADVRLFTTLFRFDVVYYGLFKCNR